MTQRKYATQEELATVNAKLDALITLLTAQAAQPNTAPQAAQPTAQPTDTAPQAPQAQAPQAVKVIETIKPDKPELPKLRGSKKFALVVYDGMAALHVDPLYEPQSMSNAVYNAFNGASYYVNIRRDGRRTPKTRAHRYTMHGNVNGQTVKSAHAWYILGIADEVSEGDVRRRVEVIKHELERIKAADRQSAGSAQSASKLSAVIEL